MRLSCLGQLIRTTAACDCSGESQDPFIRFTVFACRSSLWDQCSVMATAIIAACLMTTRADEPMMLISIGMALFVVDHHRFIFNTRLITRESVWANKQTKQSIPWCSQICCTYPMECIVAYSWKATQIDII